MKQRPGILGILLCCAGVMIILALILPKVFWWFALGAGLIIAGICLMMRPHM